MQTASAVVIGSGHNALVAASFLVHEGWSVIVLEAEAAAPFADRVRAKLERFAPGVTERVVGRHAMSPADLEAHDANLLGGDSLGASVHLRPPLAFRPGTGGTRYEMPVEGLDLCGAATWPGPGNNGTAGWLLAERLTSGVPGGAAL